MNRKTVHLTPTVIPAQPGYRCVWFALDDAPSNTTTTDEPKAFSEAVIAWIIRPGMQDVGGDVVEFTEPHVHPVTPHFAIAETDFLVSPDGQWSRYGRIFKDEAEARDTWIGEQIRNDHERREAKNGKP